jgi:hypothetical protein
MTIRISKRLLGIAAILLLALVAEAGGRGETTILWKYDLDSTNFIYCSLTPQDISVPGARIKTSGSSATVATVAGYTDPFTNVAVGDEITATSGLLATSPVTFTVTARASATSITADRAINLSLTDGAVFTYRSLRCGTADTDGWFTVPAGTNTLSIIFAQGDLTGGLDYSVQTRTRGAYGVPMQADSGTIAASTALANSAMIVLGETTSDWRVGIKAHTGDVSDATTNLEQIDISLSYQRAADTQ